MARSHRTWVHVGWTLAIGLSLLPRPSLADNTLRITMARLDPPTVITLGVQVLITDDDNHNARVTVRYRPMGSAAFREGLPLFRVRPESVVGRTVPQQFAGSVFDLAPGTTYEIELHAVDPDGSVDQTMMLTGTTRPIPRAEPTTPRMVMVRDAATLRTALNAARAGDVIQLADGMYAGTFAINASGTADNPIFIRGASTDGTILDGMGASGNVLEVYGSFVTVERLTLQNANRAIRFQGMGATFNVLRNARLRNVVLGIGSQVNQQNFYLCDNVLEGRLVWPAVYRDDGGAHANDDGIHVEGNGHVVCHNRIVGFGDAMKTEQNGARAIDVYGNDVLSAYDNGFEFDGCEGNVRLFRNRFLNNYTPLSFQPVFGGPAYAFRNVVINVADEQLKLHSLGSTMEPSGVLVYHNTFVSPDRAFHLSTSAQVHHYVLQNNLFVGPAMAAGGLVVQWDTPIDYMTGTIDYNGYFADGMYQYGYGATGMRYANFAAVRSSMRYESHGVLLSAPVFAMGLAAPSTYRTVVTAPDATPAASSGAIDRGIALANLNDNSAGAAPDLGAIEVGCPTPIYGPRPSGTNETNEPTGCTGSVTPPGDAGVSDSGPSGDAAGTQDATAPVDAGSGGDAALDGTPGDDGTMRAGGCRCRAAATARNARGPSLVAAAFVLGTVTGRRRRRVRERSCDARWR